jgi:hypothetical protein
MSQEQIVQAIQNLNTSVSNLGATVSKLVTSNNNLWVEVKKLRAAQAVSGPTTISPVEVKPVATTST